MESIIYCCECQQPISPDQDFVSFKVPGGNAYRFFHRRFRVGDCWDMTSNDRKETSASLLKKPSGTAQQKLMEE